MPPVGGIAGINLKRPGVIRHRVPLMSRVSEISDDHDPSPSLISLIAHGQAAGSPRHMHALLPECLSSSQSCRDVCTRRSDVNMKPLPLLDQAKRRACRPPWRPPRPVWTLHTGRIQMLGGVMMFASLPHPCSLSLYVSLVELSYSTSPVDQPRCSRQRRSSSPCSSYQPSL